MKKQLFFLSIFIILITTTYAQETKPKINWMTWEDAVAQHKKDMEAYSKAEGSNKIPPKKMYIDFYTSWCGWCKRMDQSTFLDPNIVAIMNQYYYPVKFNAERGDSIIFNGHTFINPNPGKSKSTHQFAASILDYQLSYPSYVILDENLQRAAIYKGFMQPDDLLGVLLFFGKNQNITYKNYLNNQFKIQQNQN